MPESKSKTDLVPQVGCFVSHPSYKGILGRVSDAKLDGSSDLVKVEWGSTRRTEWHSVSELRNGFRSGHIVQDNPKSNTRKTLGTGKVISERNIAGRDMVLVQLHRTGESRWLPYERLIRLRDAGLKYTRAEAIESDSATRFQLKALAYALESWNQVTGALDRLDVDPLPHQIDLVHRIMNSDQPNWLIADDVGLGKTIEVGLLLAALKRRRRARRVLVVCPAGVVRQWQDEMQYKFNEDFRIYGLDFNINQPSHWSSFEKVIVSIDRAKSDTHSPIFSDSGDWDVIVFDEAHHLSKIEGQAITQRYRLAEKLQQLTDTFIFLTGTPHQGRTTQFINLLLLLRPDLGRRFTNVFTDPSVVAEVILRNRKSLVTDANGEFLFRGQDTRRVEVQLSEDAVDFDIQLQTYLKYGYDAAAAGGNTGRAIGFVMTTYRKLASSSIAAIEKALMRRIARLQGDAAGFANPIDNESFDEIADAFREGEDGLDNLEDVAGGVIDANTGVNPFFDDEQAQIAELIVLARKVKVDDHKLEKFLSDIVDPLRKERQQLLIFTEYRATQEYLIEALLKRYPNVGVVQINGSMSLNEKRNSIARFNERSAQFMISTEAGGEGINLHEQCHVMVNYDLPWNPRRLVQRAGRLYRYGQRERVIVFNLMADDSFDSKSLGMMLERVHSIAKDMSEVGSEFQEGLETEIIGELLEQVDIASILADNKNLDIQRTEAEIDEAVNRAKQAKSQQDRLFSRIEGYDPQATTALYTFGQEDILAFLEGILPYVNVKIRERLYNGRVLELELPEEMRGRFSEFRERAIVVRVTVDRQLVVRNSDLVPMDFASSFFSELIETAKSPDFKGEYASLQAPKSGSLGIYKVRWQNDQGVPSWDALLPIFLPDGGKHAIVNPDFFGSMLREQAKDGIKRSPAVNSDRWKNLKRMDSRAQIELAERCTALRHPNDVVLLAAADLSTKN